MPHGDIETFLEDGEWHNRVEGEVGALSSHDDKHEAAAEGRREAQKRSVKHFIKKETGSIGEKNSDARSGRAL